MSVVKRACIFSFWIFSVTTWTVYYIVIHNRKHLVGRDNFLLQYFVDYYPEKLSGCANLSENTNLPLSYSFCDENYTFVGKPFSKKLRKYLKYFHLTEEMRYRWNDSSVLRSRPRLVSGISDDHFDEAVAHIPSWIEHSGTRFPIFIYDLGLSERNIVKLRLEFNDTVVKIVQFKFAQYPKRVKNLREYRFKPIIVAEMLLQYPSVVWTDSSVDFQPNFTRVFDGLRSCISSNPLCHLYPVILLSYTGHSVYATTHPKMVSYLPISESQGRATKMYQAAPIVVYGTQHVRTNVLKWWVFCALEDECMAPSNHSGTCHFGLNRHDYYAECHRHDQSAINILLANVNSYNWSRYYIDAEDVMIFDRKATSFINVIQFFNQLPNWGLAKT